MVLNCVIYLVKNLLSRLHVKKPKNILNKLGLIIWEKHKIQL
jgi:hypothetical protein